MAIISMEMGQDMKSMFSRMSSDQIQEMFENMLRDNDFQSLSIQRYPVMDSTGIRETYTIKLIKESNDEYGS